MADLDDISDGKDFGLDKPADTQGFSSRAPQTTIGASRIA